MWRALEAEPRQFLTGHEKGNVGYTPRRSLRAARQRSTLPRVRKHISRMGCLSIAVHPPPEPVCHIQGNLRGKEVLAEEFEQVLFRATGSSPTIPRHANGHQS